MPIPCAVVGSLPRSTKLLRAIAAYEAKQITFDQLEREMDASCAESILRMEEANHMVVTDGEQRFSSVATYPIMDTLTGTGMSENLVSDGQSELDIRKCFQAGAVRVSIDFTEGHLALRNDVRNPWTSERLLDFFIDLNNRVINRFTAGERGHIGVHMCLGEDNGGVPYEELVKETFKLNAGYFLIHCASERDRNRVFKIIGKNIRRDANGVKQIAYVGVTSAVDPRVESPEEIAQTLIAATKYIPTDQLGATDSQSDIQGCKNRRLRDFFRLRILVLGQ
ncbi:hypothetical protein FRC10_004110 [Ceratobasidium sp. 414]|nr:hypothetical protein FRC10_004110 [Ceratobasidium sp. 414]